MEEPVMKCCLERETKLGERMKARIEVTLNEKRNTIIKIFIRDDKGGIVEHSVMITSNRCDQSDNSQMSAFIISDSF